MTNITKSIIAKGVFSISVVAVMATVGVTGFAQADRRVRLAADSDGYGGTGAQVQAAVTAFQNALAAATSKFQSDVDTCVANFAPGAGSITPASTSAVRSFSAATSNPTAFSSAATFDDHFRTADVGLQNSLDADTATMLANIDHSQARANRAAFRACMNTARQTFHNSLQIARHTFQAAIHDIFHT